MKTDAIMSLSPPYLHALLYLTDVIVYYFCAPLPNLNLFALIQLVTPPPLENPAACFRGYEGGDGRRYVRYSSLIY